MAAPDDNGVTHFQRLDPAQIDVVLGSARLPRQAPPARQGSSGIWLAALAIVATAAWAWHGSDSPIAAPPDGTASLPPVQTPVQEPRQVAVVNTAVATRVVNQVVIINAPAKPAPVHSSAAPEPVATQAPQGLVSAQYLAQFKAGGGRTEASTQRPYQIATVTIREWDGPNRYVAKWRIEDNLINQGSVCFNFPADSIEHRECRRAAQQYFKDQCKDWTRRAEKTRDKETREAKAQYCAVAGEFAP